MFFAPAGVPARSDRFAEFDTAAEAREAARRMAAQTGDDGWLSALIDREASMGPWRTEAFGTVYVVELVPDVGMVMGAGVADAWARDGLGPPDDPLGTVTPLEGPGPRN